MADRDGTVWDSVFIVAETGGVTSLTLTMDANAYKLWARVLNFLIKGLITKEVARDLEQVKAYCEKDLSNSRPSL